MSSSTNSLTESAEQLALLRRAVRAPEVFGFIIVAHNHATAIEKVERDLCQHWPERPLLRLQAQKEDYYSLIRRIEQHQGFVLLEDFDYLAQNPDLYIGFNQRRDYLSTLPVQLIAFVFDDEDHLNMETCKDHLRDLWSIRNLVVEVKQEVVPAQTEVTPPTVTIAEQKQKRTELQRIQRRITDLSKEPKNTSILSSLYPQAHQLFLDLGEYEASLDWVGQWKAWAGKTAHSSKTEDQILQAEVESLELLGRKSESEQKTERDVPAKELLSRYATALGQRADYLMGRRAYLTILELENEKANLRNLRLQTSQHLSGKHLARFSANMDEVEDMLDGLIMSLDNSYQDAGKAFNTGVRTLSNQLRATASLLRTFSPILISVLSSHQ